MALGRAGLTGGQGETGSGSRPIELTGDSPELVALFLLRQVAQMEQRAMGREAFDRAWLLDTYAECLSVVRGAPRRRGAGAAGQSDVGRKARQSRAREAAEAETGAGVRTR
jgi:hypothetical protein